jgi:hypothetical protein
MISFEQASHSVYRIQLTLTSLASDRLVACLTGAGDVFTVGVGFLFFSSVTSGTDVATGAGRVVVSTTDAFCVGTGCGST